MTTPTTPEGMARWDHLGWPRDALAAWMDPGTDPDWHRQAQDDVRRLMPLLARALDREAERMRPAPGQRRRRWRREPGQGPPPPWEEGSDR